MKIFLTGILLTVLLHPYLKAQQPYPRNSIGLHWLSAERGILYERRLSPAHAISAGMFVRSYYYDEVISYRRYLDIVDGSPLIILLNPGAQLQYRYYFPDPSRTWFVGAYVKANQNTAVRYAQTWIYGTGITAGKRLAFNAKNRWFMDIQGSIEYQSHSADYPDYTRMATFEEVGFRIQPRYLYAGVYPRISVTLGRRW